MATLKRARRYYPNDESLWNGSRRRASEKFARDWFRVAYEQLQHYLPWIRRTTGHIYRMYSRGRLCQAAGATNRKVSWIERSWTPLPLAGRFCSADCLQAATSRKTRPVTGSTILTSTLRT